MTQVSPQIISQMEKGGLYANRDDDFRLLPDLDHALEWCEERLLGTNNLTRDTEIVHLTEHLKDSWHGAVEPRWLMPYLERIEVPASTHLIRQSEQSESLYFIESAAIRN